MDPHGIKSSGLKLDARNRKIPRGCIEMTILEKDRPKNGIWGPIVPRIVVDMDPLG